MGVHGTPRKSCGTPRSFMDVSTDAHESLHGHCVTSWKLHGASVEVVEARETPRASMEPPWNLHGTSFRRNFCGTLRGKLGETFTERCMEISNELRGGFRTGLRGSFHGRLHEASTEDDMGGADVGWKLPWKYSTDDSVDVFVELPMEISVHISSDMSMEAHRNVHGNALVLFTARLLKTPVARSGAFAIPQRTYHRLT